MEAEAAPQQHAAAAVPGLSSAAVDTTRDRHSATHPAVVAVTAAAAAASNARLPSPEAASTYCVDEAATACSVCCCCARARTLQLREITGRVTALKAVWCVRPAARVFAACRAMAGPCTLDCRINTVLSQAGREIRCQRRYLHAKHKESLLVNIQQYKVSRMVCCGSGHRTS